MCNIIVLKPGQMPVKTELYNMCYNNWHSFGLVTAVDGKLDIVREVPDSGEVDPDRVWGLLDKERQYLRYLHVRHNTAGATSLENTHPFDVYYQSNPERQVVFMHNGTLYDYKTTYQHGVSVWKDGAYQSPNDTGDSDTKRFTEEVLQKLALLCDGDFTTETMQLILKKFWPQGGNRGLIITSDREPIYLGDWKTRKDDNGEDYKSANDDYFTTITRGPMKSRMEAGAKRKEEEEKAKKALEIFNSPANDTPFRSESGNFCRLPNDFPTDWAEYASVFHLKAQARALTEDINFWDRGGSVSVGALTHKELENIHSDKSVCLAIMAHVFADYASMYDEMLELKDKHDRATDLIGKMKNEIEVLKNNRTLN